MGSQFKTERKGGKLYLKWFHDDGPAWAVVLAGVKALKGRTFDPIQKVWAVPDTAETLAAISALGFPLPDAGAVAPVAPESPARTHDKPPLAPLPWVGLEVDTTKAPYLRPYQVEAMQFLAHRNGRGLIGDGMGTGKTIQACGWAAINPHLRPVVIVTNQSTKKQWATALMRFGVVSPALVKGSWGKQLATPLILYGKTPRPIPTGTETVVVNWDIVADWAQAIAEFGPRILVADECQAMGNKSSKRTKAMQLLARNAEHFIPMSGTPIRTRPKQFWPTLNLIDPHGFPAERKFLFRYCGPKHNGFGFTFDGASHMDELHERLRPLMLRRMLEDVCKDVPDKTIVAVPVDADPALMGEYENALDLFWQGNRADMDEMRHKMAALTRTAFRAKEEACIAWVLEWLESNPDEKIIVFAWHRPVIAIVVERLRAAGHKPAQIDGGITGDARELQKEMFIADPACRICVANIVAAGVGLDGLQEVACNMAFLEFAPSPEDHRQAEARLYRSGQRRPVFAHYLLADGTLDMELVEIRDQRVSMISAIMDGKETGAGLDFLGELLARHGVGT